MCPALTAPTNGQVSYNMTSPYEIGTVATFTCNAGFSLNGAVDMLTCADDDQLDTVGTWGGTEPPCLRIRKSIKKNIKFFSKNALFLAAIVCPALTAPINGQLSYDMTSPYEIGTVATFTCNAGFSLNRAVDMLTCADDDQLDTVGTWGGTEPPCLRKSIIKNIKSFSKTALFLAAIVCPALTAPTNGQVSYDMTSPYEIGTVATFTCNAGFSLNGAVDMLTCADDDQLDTVGTWGGTEPPCLRIRKSIKKNIKFFSKNALFLAAIVCPALTAPTNGQVSYDMTSPYEIGTVATFTCNAGFSLNRAVDMLTCADDDQLDTVGTWGGTEPPCLRKSIKKILNFFPKTLFFLQQLCVLL